VDYAKLPAFTEENPICPGCLMIVTYRSIKSNYKGKNYYSCSTADKELFDAHTDLFNRFLAEDLVNKSKSNI
jgi:YHS domain-containing protein